MRKESARLILDQVRMRRELAEAKYKAREYENMDEQLAELRDLLDDIYDRQDEKLIEPDPTGGQ